ncbi:UvrD/REP helicase [Anopheles sinensis]|uniref:UvrD/REP helicase n=1 Tax=Anopheles sinensis TaxID=74873 RepID=A0A084W6Z6_ANOSI|nr:UvrD/REP helicase [Anopheles sinensis]
MPLPATYETASPTLLRVWPTLALPPAPPRYSSRPSDTSQNPRRRTWATLGYKILHNSFQFTCPVHSSTFGGL